MSKENRIEFHRYWLDEARYFNEVVDNPKIEEAFKTFGRKIHKEVTLAYSKGYDEGYDQGMADGKCKC